MGLVLQNESSLETIRISKSELANVVFKNGGKEISINGEMYDVKDKSADGDYTIFLCAKDKKETKLIANLNNHVKNNIDTNTPNKKQNDSSKNPLKDLFLSQKNNFISAYSVIAFPTENSKLQTINLLPLPLPPPEVSIV